MNVVTTALFIPDGEYYGARAEEVTLTVSNIFHEVVDSKALSAGTVSSGLTLRGVLYSAILDTANYAGPYVNTDWDAYINGSLVETSGRVPIIPVNYQVCLEFNSAVTDISGTSMLAAGAEYCYAIEFDPFYVPVEYFQRNGFGLFDNWTEFDIAKLIWEISQEADSEVFCTITDADSRWPYLNYAKEQYVRLKPLIQAVQGSLALGSSVRKKLADLEIEVRRDGGSVKELFQDWLKRLSDWRRVLNSCGTLSAGTSLKPKCGRIGDNYDRSVFGRYVSTMFMQTTSELISSVSPSTWYALSDGRYISPPSNNHLFTDPYSFWWLK